MESDIPELHQNKNSNTMGCFWVIVFVIAIGWFINSKWNDYNNGEKDPFWKGTENIQVCKVPYYSSSECYKLNVDLIDKHTAQIHFPNGGFKVTGRMVCYFAGKMYNNEPRSVFCRSWDSDGQQWDFMPAWINY